MILFLIFFTLQYKFISALLIQTFPSSSLLPDIPTLPVLDILVFTSRDRPPCLSNQNDSTACPSPPSAKPPRPIAQPDRVRGIRSAASPRARAPASQSEHAHVLGVGQNAGQALFPDTLSGREGGTTATTGNIACGWWPTNGSP